MIINQINHEDKKSVGADEAEEMRRMLIEIPKQWVAEHTNTMKAFHLRLTTANSDWY